MSAVDDREARAVLHQPLLDARDVAALLRIPRSTVYELVRRGCLPCIRIGRHVRFVREDPERALAEGRPSP